MTFIAIGNALVFVLGMFEPTFLSMLIFDWSMIMRGQVWRLISFIFVPEGSWLALIAIYFYYWLGRTLENEWGSLKLTLFYLLGMFFTILYGAVSGSGVNSIYLNMSLFLAYATINPNQQIRLYFLIPIKMKWLAILDIAITVLTCVMSRSLLPFVPLLSYIIFFWSYFVSLVKRQSNHHSNVVNFSKARKEAVFATKISKTCATCGKTDASHPSLEFRYCSKCSDGKCYCAEHIFNHEHK